MRKILVTDPKMRFTLEDIQKNAWYNKGFELGASRQNDPITVARRQPPKATPVVATAPLQRINEPKGPHDNTSVQLLPGSPAYNAALKGLVGEWIQCKRRETQVSDLPVPLHKYTALHTRQFIYHRHTTLAQDKGAPAISTSEHSNIPEVALRDERAVR